MADYFEAAIRAGASGKQAANLMMGDLSAAMNRHELEIQDIPVKPGTFAEIIIRMDDGTLSTGMAREVFEAVWKGEGSPETIIESRGLKQVTDSGAIDALVQQVIDANPDQVQQFREGKQKVIGFLVGQVMKASGGKVDPKQVNALMREKLGA
jgi:aspartyl-tRNA(Asn)/glutamyl-tRNA(Gln) amidotransferase subunit B